MILSLIGSIVHFLVNAYILVLFIRMILDWVAVLASAWRPRGLASSLIDAVYQLTEPPLRWLRQYIRPIPMGPIYFDVAFIVLYFILIAIDFLKPKARCKIYGSVDAERYQRAYLPDREVQGGV